MSLAAVTSTSSYENVLRRLERASHERHTHAAELPWDDPGHALSPDDPRLELPAAFDPLADTDWFRSLPAAERSRVGLYRYASSMKTGWQFENYLQQGLLRYALGLADDAPEFRYLHHEVAEESEHSSMFFEFIRRSGQRVKGMPGPLKRSAQRVAVPMATRFPALFFILVLGGEEPVDMLQKRHLRQVEGGHPLVERIMSVHVTEEARHLSFARQYLITQTPKLSRGQRRRLALAAPMILGLMARLMVYPPRDLQREFKVPAGVVDEVIHSERTAQLLKDSVSRTRRLLRDLGLVTPVSKRLWVKAGIWDEDPRSETKEGA